MNINLLIEANKTKGASLIGTIKLVKDNLNCTIKEATDLVVNSPSWLHHKANFEQQQANLWSVIEELADSVEFDSTGNPVYTISIKDDGL